MGWLQRVELIEKDKYCDRILAQWGDVPLGVRVRLRDGKVMKWRSAR
jgi:hypothetical protein